MFYIVFLDFYYHFFMFLCALIACKDLFKSIVKNIYKPIQVANFQGSFIKSCYY